MTMNVLNSLGVGAKAPTNNRDTASSAGADRQDFAALLQDVPGANDRPVARDPGDKSQGELDRTADQPATDVPSSTAVKDEKAPDLAFNTNNTQSQQMAALEVGTDEPKATPKHDSEKKSRETVTVDAKRVGLEAKNASKIAKENADTKEAEASPEPAVAPASPDASVAISATGVEPTPAAVPGRQNVRHGVEEIGVDKKLVVYTARTSATNDAKDTPVGDGAKAVAATQPAIPSKSADAADTPSDSDAPVPAAVKPGEVTDLLDMLARRAKDASEDKMDGGKGSPPPLADRGVKLAVTDPATAKGPSEVSPTRISVAAVRVQGADADKPQPPARNAAALAAAIPDVPARDHDDHDSREGRGASDRLSALFASAGISGATSNNVVTAQFHLSGDGMATTPAARAGDSISVALGQQVVDMGVTGQWLDRISQQIAAVGNGQGRGSFNLNSETMGAMRVDLTPGATGMDVRMTVESEAAATALTRDSGRLLQDAQLSAVRIGEVRIDKVAHVAEPTRSEMGNGQQQGQNASSNGGLANMNHNGSQQRGGAAAMAGQDLGRGTGGGNAKADAGATVSGDRAPEDDNAASYNRGGRRARYA
ncbi:MAG: flagellar hook-length control protein FliK [Sphingobium sp.]